MSPESLARESSSAATSAASGLALAGGGLVGLGAGSGQDAGGLGLGVGHGLGGRGPGLGDGGVGRALGERQDLDTSAASSSGERTGRRRRGRRRRGGEVGLELVDPGLQQGLGARGLGGPGLGRLGVGGGLAQLLLELGHGGAHALEEVVDLVGVVALAGLGELDVGEQVRGSSGGLHPAIVPGSPDRGFIPRTRRCPGGSEPPGQGLQEHQDDEEDDGHRQVEAQPPMRTGGRSDRSGASTGSVTVNSTERTCRARPRPTTGTSTG